MKKKTLIICVKLSGFCTVKHLCGNFACLKCLHVCLHNTAIVSAQHLDEWVCGRKKTALVKKIHPHLSCNPSIWHTSAASFSAALYLAGLSDSTSLKTSSGLGSGMGMMYSLYEVVPSCMSASCPNSPGLRLWL